MTAWFRVVKRIHGADYLYLQRSYRVPGRKHPKVECIYIGRFDAGAVSAPADRDQGGRSSGSDGTAIRRRRRPSRLAALAIGTFGDMDEYHRPYDSLYNRWKERRETAKAAEVKPQPQEPAVSPQEQDEKEAADDTTAQGGTAVSSGES